MLPHDLIILPTCSHWIPWPSEVNPNYFCLLCPVCLLPTVFLYPYLHLTFYSPSPSHTHIQCREGGFRCTAEGSQGYCHRQFNLRQLGPSTSSGLDRAKAVKFKVQSRILLSTTYEYIISTEIKTGSNSTVCFHLQRWDSLFTLMGRGFKKTSVIWVFRVTTDSNSSEWYFGQAGTTYLSLWSTYNNQDMRIWEGFSKCVETRKQGQMNKYN